MITVHDLCLCRFIQTFTKAVMITPLANMWRSVRIQVLSMWRALLFVTYVLSLNGISYRQITS